MYEKLTCDQCGRTYENKNLMKGFRLAKLGKDFCSDGCRKTYERNHEKPKSSSVSEKSNTQVKEKTQRVERVRGADEILASAQAEQMGYELSMKRKEDNALRPWMFDSNFSSAEGISKISFPDSAEDIEKTVLRIIKSGVEQVKSVVDLTNNEFQLQTLSNPMAMLKPFHEEISFADTCIEKASEGIKKLRRFEDHEAKAMYLDCQESLDDFKNKWYARLVEKRDKKKKQDSIKSLIIIVLVVIVAIGMAIASI